MRVIKELKGYSGSKLFLMQDEKHIFVRKIGNVTRNLERYLTLKRLNLNIPDILTIDTDSYDMEYIPNLDIKTFLHINQTYGLIKFIKNTLNKLSENSFQKDYSTIFETKLSQINFEGLNFSKTELFDKLPKLLPCSEYHGDFTLENILYNYEKEKFILIDPLTTEYDSYVFDIAKLKQDIVCKWFIRKDTVYIDSKLQKIYKELEAEFKYFSDPYLTILMLLRILPYSNADDSNFLIKEVNKLWK